MGHRNVIGRRGCVRSSADPTRESVKWGTGGAQSMAHTKIPYPANAEAEEEDLEVTQSALEDSSGAYKPAAITAAAGTSLTPPITITYSGTSCSHDNDMAPTAAYTHR